MEKLLRPPSRWLADRTGHSKLCALKYLNGDASLSHTLALAFDKAFTHFILLAIRERNRLRGIHNLNR